MRRLRRAVILLKRGMREEQNIVILTGAGISADSGVPTFRDSGGIWAKYDYREVATPEGYAANPALVHEFYNLRRAGLRQVEPNAAHTALAQLEQHLSSRGGELTIVTQNVDDLHERGGAQNIIHMHGELTKVRCTNCSEVRIWRGDLTPETVCPDCAAVGCLRPDIVWFGEMPMFMDLIEEKVAAANLFVSIGTSGSVYPAAGFVGVAQSLGVQCMEINLEPSENAYLFDETRYGPAVKAVPEWVMEIIKGK